ncbi:MAG: DUF2807 domain-containing protein [Myxococcaceae bacterium]|nr:DUF2807 domain-containing protein [Myxococcaceae bacterium]
MRAVFIGFLGFVVGCAQRSEPLPHGLTTLTVQGPVDVQVLVSDALEPAIRLDSMGGARWSFTPARLEVHAVDPDATERPRVSITARRLSTVRTADGAAVTMNRLRGGRLDVVATHGARLIVVDADADTLSLEATRDGHLDVGGRARVVEARADDVGRIAAGALAAGVARVRANALSTVTLRAPDFLRAELSRASRLRLDGPAKHQLVQRDDSSTLDVAQAETAPPGLTRDYPTRRMGRWGMPSSSYGAPSGTKPSEP